MWAFRPLRGVDVEAIQLRTNHSSRDVPKDTQPKFDPSAFATANLWHVPAQPEAAAVVQAPASDKPLNVQLIGIINEDGIRKAALYDSESDRILIVSHGDRIRGEYLVTSISDTGIELTSDASTHRLQLEGEPS